jgi:hypothetical protein
MLIKTSDGTDFWKGFKSTSNRKWIPPTDQDTKGKTQDKQNYLEDMTPVYTLTKEAESFKCYHKLKINAVGNAYEAVQDDCKCLVDEKMDEEGKPVPCETDDDCQGWRRCDVADPVLGTPPKALNPPYEKICKGADEVEKRRWGGDPDVDIGWNLFEGTFTTPDKPLGAKIGLKVANLKFSSGIGLGTDITAWKYNTKARMPTNQDPAMCCPEELILDKPLWPGTQCLPVDSVGKVIKPDEDDGEGKACGVCSGGMVYDILAGTAGNLEREVERELEAAEASLERRQDAALME